MSPAEKTAVAATVGMAVCLISAVIASGLLWGWVGFFLRPLHFWLHRVACEPNGPAC